MSEYQYYEFAAIDSPLSVEEQADLRAISTRALITPTSFVNHYEWGDLKADPRQLVERFFDAFLYLANWGTQRLIFRLPAESLGPSASAVAEQYLGGDCTKAWTTDGYVVIDLFAEDDDGLYDGEWLDGSGLLASIVPGPRRADDRGPAASLPRLAARRPEWRGRPGRGRTARSAWPRSVERSRERGGQVPAHRFRADRRGSRTQRFGRD